MPPAATLSVEDVTRFSRHAQGWWEPNGPLAPLHRLNPVRVEYIRDAICAHDGRKADQPQALKNLSVLDVGCGGGILSEPLARMGAKVTGLDAAAEAIDVAREHARHEGLTIDYRAGCIEDLARGKTRFDVITAMEVMEHVADGNVFLSSLATLLKPDGLLIMSTLSRTPKSFLLGIAAAEYILGWVPRGTHKWSQFLRPSEMVEKLEGFGLRVIDLTGLVFNPLRGAFQLSRTDLAVNYLLTAIPSRAPSRA